MLVRLSSKGQLVIPKIVRQRLNLERDAVFQIHVTEEGSIILDPVRAGALTAMQGKYAGVDFLTPLEAEHREEVSRDAARRA